MPRPPDPTELPWDDEDDDAQATEATRHPRQKEEGAKGQGLLACSKRQYDSKKHVIRAHRFASFRVRAYKCPDCGRWHANNQDKR